MSAKRRRRPENVAGELFVDDSCIDCDTCRWMAPASFDREAGKSRVHTQPDEPEQLLAALRALVSCPTGSIRSEGKLEQLPEAMAGLPAPVDGPVLHCGWHAEASFGAASWLILRESGNVLVDSPRFAAPLVERIEALGGVHTMVLTHKDDVADHARFAERFGARRILHAGDMGPGLAEVEVLLEGSDEVQLAPGLTIIPTPGHTAGSLCLAVDRTWLFTGDHLAWSERRGALTAFPEHCWHDWELQRASVERLMAQRFSWVLPGHGRMVQLPPAEMALALADCVAWMASVKPAGHAPTAEPGG
ncbi:MAG: MBL fold metallo-hydrolase [Planctomycetota bacterium]|nr:MAG: MBL fold metallo-hydrolase [Planctomycetota bacterium]